MFEVDFFDTDMSQRTFPADARADKILAIIKKAAPQFFEKRAPVKEEPKILAYNTQYDQQIKMLRNKELLVTLPPSKVQCIRNEKPLKGKSKKVFQTQYGYDYDSYVGTNFLNDAKLRQWRRKLEAQIDTLMFIGKLATSKRQILPYDQPAYKVICDKLTQGPRWASSLEDRLIRRKEKIRISNRNYYLKMKTLSLDDPSKQKFVASRKKYKDMRQGQEDFKVAARGRQKVYKAKLGKQPQLAAERKEKLRLASQKYREKKEANKKLPGGSSGASCVTGTPSCYMKVI